MTLGTTAQRGIGWYNSHGFVAPWNGTNEYVQAYGSGEGIESDADLPDLVAAIGSNGQIGCIQKHARGTRAATPEAAVSTGMCPRTIPLYVYDGTTVIGDFTIS